MQPATFPLKVGPSNFRKLVLYCAFQYFAFYTPLLPPESRRTYMVAGAAVKMAPHFRQCPGGGVFAFPPRHPPQAPLRAPPFAGPHLLLPIAKRISDVNHISVGNQPAKATTNYYQNAYTLPHKP